MENDNFNFQLNNFDQIADDEAEFIPLLSTEDEEQMNAEKIPDVLPILSLRNTVLFPGVVIPITVGRDKSIKLIKDAYKGDKIIGVLCTSARAISKATRWRVEKGDPPTCSIMSKPSG